MTVTVPVVDALFGELPLATSALVLVTLLVITVEATVELFEVAVTLTRERCVEFCEAGCDASVELIVRVVKVLLLVCVEFC